MSLVCKEEYLLKEYTKKARKNPLEIIEALSFTPYLNFYKNIFKNVFITVRKNAPLNPSAEKLNLFNLKNYTNANYFALMTSTYFSVIKKMMKHYDSVTVEGMNFIKFPKKIRDKIDNKTLYFISCEKQPLKLNKFLKKMKDFEEVEIIEIPLKNETAYYAVY